MKRDPHPAFAATGILGLLLPLIFVCGCAKEGGFSIDGGPLLRPDAATFEPLDTGVMENQGPDDSGELDADGLDAAEPDSSEEPDSGEPPDSGVLVDAGPMPSPMMTFFVTSVGNGASAGNLGGVDGADQRCTQLANAVGAPARTWRAYLSTDSVSAALRIGSGPWFNFFGNMVASSTTTLHQDQIPSAAIVDELGQPVPAGEIGILTGATATGTTADTASCRGWTQGDDGVVAELGRSDWDQVGGMGRFNSGTRSAGCSAANLTAVNSTGRTYCFAQ